MSVTAGVVTVEHVAHGDVAGGVADGDLELVGRRWVSSSRTVAFGGPRRSTKNGLPLTSSEVHTWLMLSTACGQATETLVGDNEVTDSVGGGLGGVVSGGVVRLTVLLFAERLPAMSMA